MKFIGILSVLMVGIVDSLFPQQRVVTNPAYEFRTSGIYQIEKIESTESETRVHVRCTFIPGWWVNFSKQTFIKPSGTDGKLFVTDMVGGVIDERITMPATGDSAFVLIFPALPPEAQEFDFAEDGKEIIFGLSLVNSQTPIESAKEIPEEVQRWFDQAVAESRVKEPITYETSAFFTRDTARLVGYLNGYDPRAGFSTGMIYAHNIITDEDYPLVVQLYEDGRFEAQIPMQHPIHTAVVFERKWVPFYIEPGQTLSMVVDWDEFLEADRKRNVRYKFNDVAFTGPSARINDELLRWEIPYPDYLAMQQKQKSTTPADFKRERMLIWKEETASLEAQFARNNLLPQTEALLRAELMISHGTYLLDFPLHRNYFAEQDSTNEVLKVPVEDQYYDFLQELPLDDPLILATRDFSTFINRFEYCKPFENAYSRVISTVEPQKHWKSFLFEELGLTPSEDDKEFLEMEQSLQTRLNQAGGTESDQQALIKQVQEKATAFFKRYAKEMEIYSEKYIKTQPTVNPIKQALIPWETRDSLLQSRLNLSPSFAYEVAKVRSIHHTFENELSANKDDARVFLTTLEQGITHPFLLSEAERMFHAAYPDQPKQAYDLPEGNGTAVFKKLVDPHKGKFVFVDFWATTCGPCVGSIKHYKETRKKYRNNPDFDFVFVTSEQESPKQSYDDFITEQELVHTHRLSADDFRLLRQLFKFNGIPRYVVIDPEGGVLNDDFPMHNFEHELTKILESHKLASGG